MSLQFIITKLLVRLSGSKRITGLPEDKMLKQIRRRNKLNHFYLPKDGKFLYRDRKVQLQDPDGVGNESSLTVTGNGTSAKEAGGSFLPDERKRGRDVETSPLAVGNAVSEFHCLAICQKEKPKRAVLCVYGGGLLLAPPRMFVGFAKKMAENTGADVWFPYYPLCDEYTIRDSVRMLYEVYSAMRREYCDVRWYGYSSGGALLLLLGA